MNLSLFQIVAATIMVGVALTLFLLFRRYLSAGSDRRMHAMLQRVGLDRAIALSGDTETIVREIRRRCSSCSAEGVCERWLAGREAGDNAFCPNAEVFEALKKTAIIR